MYQDPRLEQLLEMGFPLQRCVEALSDYGSVEQAINFIMENPDAPDMHQIISLDDEEDGESIDSADESRPKRPRLNENLGDSSSHAHRSPPRSPARSSSDVARYGPQGQPSPSRSRDAGGRFSSPSRRASGHLTLPTAACSSSCGTAASSAASQQPCRCTSEDKKCPPLVISIANRSNMKAKACDVVHFKDGVCSCWKTFSTSTHIMTFFDEAQRARRAAYYHTWQYKLTALNCHDGSNMHVANEEDNQFRWVPAKGRMSMNMNFAVCCAIKDFQFTPRAITCSYRVVRLTEEYNNSQPDIAATTPMKFNAPHNHNDQASEQPPGMRFPLKPEQLRTLGWMQARERSKTPFKLTHRKMFHGWLSGLELNNRGVLFTDVEGKITGSDRRLYSNLLTARVDYSRKWLDGEPAEEDSESNRSPRGVDVELESAYASSGGILADPSGFGKTATMLGLIAFDAPEIPKSTVTLDEEYVAHGSLVIVPHHLLGQWVVEIGKFYLPRGISTSDEKKWREAAAGGRAKRGLYGCPRSILFVDAASRLKSVTLEELAAYDIVLCSTRLFESPKYIERREELRIDKKNRANTNEKMKSPVMEQLQWRRVVYDEPGDIRTTTGLRALSYWGLVDSRSLNTLHGIHTISAIMRVELIGWDHKHLGWTKNELFRRRVTHFVETFVRANTESSLRPSHDFAENVVHVPLLPEERALYLGAMHNGNNARLVQLCSHFSGESQNVDSKKEVDEVLGKKRADAQVYADSLEDLFSVCAWLDFNRLALSIVPASWSWFFVATAAAETMQASTKEEINAMQERARSRQVFEGELRVKDDDGRTLNWEGLRSWSWTARKIELVKFCKRIPDAIKKYGEVHSAFKFFETTVSVLRSTASDRSCPVCMDDDMELREIVISSCGHVICLACLPYLLQRQECGICRFRPLRAKDFAVLAQQNDPQEDDALKFGSKICALRNKLVEIRRQDAKAKVIIVYQYGGLRLKYEKALQQFDIPTVTVRGTAAQQMKCIEEFQDEKSKAWVFMMDFANGHSLPAANHVIFIHPLVLDTPQEAAAYEQLAIRRCHRYGQKKPVKVWRFVTTNTIEADITNEHLRLTAN